VYQKPILSNHLKNKVMKGTLQKTDRGWLVEYLVDEKTPIGRKSWIEKIPLHPDSIESINIWDGQQVEFEIVPKLQGVTDAIISYAKIKSSSKSLEEDIEKLAEITRNNINEIVYCCSGEAEEHSFDMGFVSGYNKAKENLYTEDEVYGFLEFYNTIDVNKIEFRYMQPTMCGKSTEYNREIDKKILSLYIQSLKKSSK